MRSVSTTTLDQRSGAPGGPSLDVLRRALEMGRSKRASSADSLREFRYVGSSLSPVSAGQAFLVGFSWRNYNR